jgi:deoxyribose-phosphate aldolase
VNISNKQNIAKLIDHSLLRPDVTAQEIVKLCEEAVKFGFYSVCLQPSFVRKAKELLAKTKIKITTVVGFPLGMTFSEVKIYEAMEAVLHGADELDIVMNLGFAKSNDWGKVKKDVSDIITATPEAVHKVIIETCYLTDDEKKKASLMVMNAGANYIKTSTGFATAGAVVKDVEIITSITKREIGIKAAGGIKTLEDLTAFIDAGATRIGTSSGVAIMEEVDNLLKRIQGIQESKH